MMRSSSSCAGLVNGAEEGVAFRASHDHCTRYLNLIDLQWQPAFEATSGDVLPALSLLKRFCDRNELGVFLENGWR